MRITADEIASASVAVALVGVVVAIVSARSARRSEKAADRSAAAAERSATAAEGYLAVESERILRDSRPRLSGVAEQHPGGRGTLTVTLDSDEPLTALDVWIPPEQGTWFAASSPGVQDPDDDQQFSFRAFSHANGGRPSGLGPRVSVTWQVRMEGTAPDEFRVEADCYGRSGRHWPNVLIMAKVEPDIAGTMW